MSIEPDRLRDVFCYNDERVVGPQLAFSYERERIILAENEITNGLLARHATK